MDKRQVRRSRKMEMGQFLRSYYGLDNEQLILSFCNLSHKDLKRVAPLYGIKLSKVNFNLVSMEQILNGTIILVEDAFGNPAPYINPNRDLSWKDEFNTDLTMPEKVLKKYKLRKVDEDGKY